MNKKQILYKNNEPLDVFDPQGIFDIVHPIGEVYVQYPNMEDPNVLYGKYSFWSKIDYNGAFF